jgi:hypothetical protein
LQRNSELKDSAYRISSGFHRTSVLGSAEKYGIVGGQTETQTFNHR